MFAEWLAFGPPPAVVNGPFPSSRISGGFVAWSDRWPHSGAAKTTGAAPVKQVGRPECRCPLVGGWSPAKRTNCGTGAIAESGPSFHLKQGWDFLLSSPWFSHLNVRFTGLGGFRYMIACATGGYTHGRLAWNGSGVRGSNIHLQKPIAPEKEKPPCVPRQRRWFARANFKLDALLPRPRLGTRASRMEQLAHVSSTHGGTFPRVVPRRWKRWRWSTPVDWRQIMLGTVFAAHFHYG